jgi:transposase
MMIIGCDFHTRYQQIAMMKEGDGVTGEVIERRLEHASGEADAFYRGLREKAVVGIEATGPIQWFQRLLADLGHELWVGDAAQIRACAVRKQKTDPRDARLILELMLTKRFPRIWVPSGAEYDLRQLLRHRHKLVGMRTSVFNQLHAMAMGQGLCRKKKLFTTQGRPELESLSLYPWASRRRKELLRLLDQLDPSIDELDQAVKKEASQRKDAVRLMTHPGIGPVTALAFVLTIGPVARFLRSSQIVSYLGLNPREHSSGGRQRTGAISKQGNTMVRWLLVEAAQQFKRFDPELQRDYQRLKFRKGHAVTKVAIARKLAVRMYWMLRSGSDYAQLVRHARQLAGHPDGSTNPSLA